MCIWQTNDDSTCFNSFIFSCNIGVILQKDLKHQNINKILTEKSKLYLKFNECLNNNDKNLHVCVDNHDRQGSIPMLNVHARHTITFIRDGLESIPYTGNTEVNTNIHVLTHMHLHTCTNKFHNYQTSVSQHVSGYTSTHIKKQKKYAR